MSLFSRFKAFMRKEPEEQIAGYSLLELKAFFSAPTVVTDNQLPEYPQAVYLGNAGIPAFYSTFLISDEDTLPLLSLIELNFTYKSEKQFNGLPTKKFVNNETNKKLVLFISTREFNSTTVRLITNSVDFLNAIALHKFATPPPWVVFQGYNPSWWGGDMQGAQGYYSDNYFFPFFSQLSRSDKQEYYAKFEATHEWISHLELIFADE